MATLVEIPPLASTLAPPLPACILVNNIPSEHTTVDIYDTLRDKGGIPSIPDVRVCSNAYSTGSNYALATVSNVDDVPSSIEIQAGLPSSPVTVIFQELAMAEFVLNEKLLTAECQHQILNEGFKLSVSLSFSQEMTLSVTGTCSQIHKFRQYLAALLTENALSVSSQCIPITDKVPSDISHRSLPIEKISIPKNEIPVQHVNVPTTNSSPSLTIPAAPPFSTTTAVVPSNPAEESKSFTGLSHDVLLLMSRVSAFKGMVFHPEEGRVEILPSTEEEQEQCITKFRQLYQEITKNRQLKSGDICVPVSFPPENLVALFEEFNEKYNLCHFSYDEKKQTIRIISISLRQFEQAKRLITNKLEEGEVKPKEVKLLDNKTSKHIKPKNTTLTTMSGVAINQLPTNKDATKSTTATDTRSTAINTTTRKSPWWTLSLNDPLPIGLPMGRGILAEPMSGFLIPYQTSEPVHKYRTPPVIPLKTPPPKNEKEITEATEIDTRCPICLNGIAKDPVSTPCCKQVFCRYCIIIAMEYSSYCPICKKALRPVKGNQPPGTMEHRISSGDVAGYKGCGSIVITYTIPSGIQGPKHPNPGTGYHGISHTAYLPNNAEGQHVLGLLKRAFDAGLIFTIGTSHTTNTPNAVVWNDIHHKTNRLVTMYGHPDPTYLERVKEELKAKGIE